MSDKTIRLRVVVQRNGLPEDKFMLPVSLEDGPTVAKLLEQVSSTYFPLESDQWGLEDYVVYRQAPDGNTFECLHFSPIQSLFRDDDQVLVRPLQTDDVRRRRLGGRYQISSDGKHLLDGVPFGRPLLRSPPSRPPVYIPPRKKRKLLYDRDDPATHVRRQNSPGENYTPEADDEKRSMLLLTKDLIYPTEADSQAGEDSDDDADEEFETDLSEDNSDLEGEEDLEEELQTLREENAMHGEGTNGATTADTRASRSRHARSPDTELLDDVSALHAAFPSAPLDVCGRILEASDGDLREAYTTLCNGFAPELSDSATLARIRTGKTMPKSSSRIEPDSSGNATALKLARNTLGDVKDRENPEDDENEINEVSAFVRQFDRRGLPPGTISSGKSLSRVAVLTDPSTRRRFSGDSETTSVTLVGNNGTKLSPGKAVDSEEDEETSSSGTSSSSGGEESEEGDENGSEASDDDDSLNKDSSYASSDDEHSGPSDVLTQAGSLSSDEGDSGPEQATTKCRASTRPDTHREAHGANYVNARLSESRNAVADNCSSDSTSDMEISESDSSSESDSDEDTWEKPPISTLLKTPSDVERTAPVSMMSQNRPAPGVLIAPPVPPGQGKESTKSRNARRRAAQKAKKQQAQVRAIAQQQAATAQTTSVVSDGPVSSTHASPAVDQALSTQQSLFEAKRRALLDAIASGGVEIDLKGEQLTTDVPASSKRKLGETEMPAARDQTPDNTPATGSASAPSNSSQKRRRIDMGAGRRLLFGALGLPNPKGQEDAEIVRAKLMEGVRPHTNLRLEQDASRHNEAVDRDVITTTEQAEGPDAWREAIVYRAVECCQEGVELSEPPFPFVQRWDPQQQCSWSHKESHKRGGRAKRAQRNQVHFYGKDSPFDRRKHGESFEWDANGYDETFNGIDDYPCDADNVQLNYDDSIGRVRETNDPVAEASQFTDMEDLPSLPRDLSSLPTLRPGDVQPGMVITWKKWSCSRATSWEPRLSDVTGVVVRIDDDVTGVEVCLAKRDRDLDGNEKQYDPVTGQRVYDKFEAPDLDEDDDGAAAEQDEGYRTLSFAEMQEPRVLQQPLPSDQALPSVEGANPNEGVLESQGPDCARPFKKWNENASSLPTKTSHIPEAFPVKNHDADIGKNVNADTDVESAQCAVQHAVGGARTSSNSTEHQQGQGQQDPALSSMPSMPSVSQVNSDSQQHREATNQPIDASSFDPSIVESSGYKGDVDTEAIDTVPLLSDSVCPTDRSEAPTFDAGDGELITSTPKVAHPRGMAPSSASSVRSGRQLDYTMEENGPESLRVTEADDDDPITGNVEEEGISTPILTPTHTKTSRSFTNPKVITPSKTAERPSSNPSTPGSIESLNTILCTARASRQTEGPMKLQQTAEKMPRDPAAVATEDIIYEDAMRKLDEQSDHERDEGGSLIIPDSLRRVGDGDAIPKALNEDEDEDEDEDGRKELLLPKTRRRPTTTQIKISPPPPKRTGSGRGASGRRKEASSQLTLPPGTQVIDLLSSSDVEPEPEPQFAKDYADDDVDGTYSPKLTSLPEGPGWVTKSVANRTHNAKSSAAPLGSRPFVGRAAKRGLSASQSQSQGSTPMSFSPPSSSLPELGRKVARVGGRRKTSARF